MNNNDQRQETRLMDSETVFVELASATPDGSVAEEILVCNSLDLSANGLQISVNQPLEVNRILHVAVQFDELPDPVNVVTEVKWLFQTEDEGNWVVGLAIIDSQDTSTAAWKLLIANRLEQVDREVH